MRHLMGRCTLCLTTRTTRFTTKPRLRDVSAMLRPHSKGRTACYLNTNVQPSRFPFPACVSLRYYRSSRRETLCEGRVRVAGGVP
jgi:hypothetical protein